MSLGNVSCVDSLYLYTVRINISLVYTVLCRWDVLIVYTCTSTVTFKKFGNLETYSLCPMYNTVEDVLVIYTV